MCTNCFTFYVHWFLEAFSKIIPVVQYIMTAVTNFKHDIGPNSINGLGIPSERTSNVCDHRSLKA